MKKFKQFLNETLDPDTRKHFETLSDEEKEKARQRFERFAKIGAIDQQTLRPMGWRTATGPIHDRDFHGRGPEDYRKIYQANRRSGASHEEAAQHVEGMRKKAHEEGLAAINTTRGEHLRIQRNFNNLAAADNIKREASHAGELFRVAMGAADTAHQFFKNPTEHFTAKGLNPGAAASLATQHTLSPEAAKHLDTITRMARETIHRTIVGGLTKSSREFAEHAKTTFRDNFSGAKPSDFGYSRPQDVIPSLIRPHRVRQILTNYSTMNSNPHRGPHEEYVTDTYQFGRTDGIISDHYGTHPNSLHRATTHIGSLMDIHPVARHLNLGTSHRTTGTEHAVHPHEDVIGNHMLGHRALTAVNDEAPAGTHENWTGHPTIGGYRFTPEHGSQGERIDVEKRKDAVDTARSGMQQGISHIWRIPNLSRTDRRNLMKHFEVQMRHHHVAAMASPQRFAEYHAGKARQEAEAAARQRQQARDRARQRASAGGSGEAPPPRRGGWEYKEQPHEILGVARDASPDEIKRAFRQLSIKHHPDQGGSAEMMKKINAAHRHMRGLNEMVSILIMNKIWKNKK